MLHQLVAYVLLLLSPYPRQAWRPTGDVYSKQCCYAAPTRGLRNAPPLLFTSPQAWQLTGDVSSQSRCYAAPKFGGVIRRPFANFDGMHHTW
jgi:hypothetical protein